MTSGGYGVIPYGSSPYGGGLVDVSGEEFDVFCFRDLDMFQILSSSIIDYTPVDPLQFYPDPTTLDLDVRSGGAVPTLDARIWAIQSVNASFTVEWIVKFDKLPNDFTDLTNSHIYLGATDAAGALVGLFFSKVGIAYTGSVSFPSGNLQLDCTFQQLPGSSSYVSETDYWVVRAAVAYDLGIVYLYITELSAVAVSGHQLRAILPVIPFSAAATTPIDQVIVSARGTAAAPSYAFLDSMCLGSSLIIPNLAPEANAGQDKAVRLCSIVQLDGSSSYDPEGAPLGYQWRLVEGPITSSFVVQVHDGWTDTSPSGFVTRVYSQSLGAVDAGTDPIAVGDVITLLDESHTIVGKGIDGSNFYVQIGSEIIPQGLSTLSFKYLRQRGISNPTSVKPTFFPDSAGFYSFDLVVHDGSLSSSPSLTIINVLESPLPRGCTPDLTFIFSYLSDFWKLVEDRDRIAVFWSAVAQVVATELFTLWQYEYSKSLRDIQRTFVRRWLHYDLLLPEPLPELTKIRAFYGGVSSSTFATATIQGFALHLVSDALDGGEATITFTKAGLLTPAQVAEELQTKIQGFVDSRFTAYAPDGGTLVRIDAPFPFSVGTDTTLSLFTAGDVSSTLTGSAGAGVGTRTYKVDRSLEGLGIQEDDFLSLAGAAYRITAILDNPADAHRYQRVVVKEDLPTVPSATWHISGWVSSELLNFYDGLVSYDDPVDFEVTSTPTGDENVGTTFELVSTTILGVCPSVPGRAAFDAYPLGARLVDSSLRVLLARVVRRTYVPIDALIVDVPTLQQYIVVEDDEATLRRNVDFFIEEFRGRSALRFVSGQSGDLGDIWEDKRPPNRLWAEYTYVDNSPLIEANFGLAAGLTVAMMSELPVGVDYLSAVRGLWYAFYNGPTLRNLRIGVQILLGLPFAEERGTIEEIRTDFSATQGRLLVRDVARPEIVRSYNYPRVLAIETNPVTGVSYVVGDVVEQFAPLVEGAEVIDYVKEPEWFEGLISQGIFYEVEKYHKFLVRVDEAAFDLEALLFARDFILKAKPTYTYPLFFVRLQVGETEISITDEQQFNVKLILTDGICSNLLGASWGYDDPRAGGGGWRNQFDASPSAPAPSAPIRWGWDKSYLCPTDELTGIWCELIPTSFVVFFDGPLSYDTNVAELIGFEDVSPGTIPAGPTGYTMTATGSPVVDASGTATQLRFIALGGPGTDDTDYELVVENVTAVTEVVVPFTDGTNTEILETISLAVTVGDTLSLRVRPATGGARAPSWSKITAQLTVGESHWHYDETLGDGVYCIERQMP